MNDAFIHRLIEAAADRHPEAVAVRAGREVLSYAELDRRANRMARYIIDKGAVDGAIVGLCVGRVPDLIVAMLGILKAGCAYLPLDPAYPVDRLLHMLTHSGARLIVTEQRQAELFGAAAALLLVDSDTDRVAALPDGRISLPPDAHRLAYVIYTSGSTGVPKGVMIEHASLSSYVYAVQKVTPLTPADSVLQFATINFDAAAEEIFPCLVNGATLVLMAPPATLSMAEFTAFCTEAAITFTVITTGYWNVFVDHLSHHPDRFPPSLRTVVFGGERAHPHWVEVWCAIVPPEVRLFNAYGPTETTIAVSLYEVPRDFPRLGRTVVPVGRALGNAVLRVLDAAMHEISPGDVGELWIGGACLGRGYLGNEFLTNSKFVQSQDNFSGERMYRSGDLARCDERGCVEILGRVDDQVKIRGFLVEPTELERTLGQISGIQDAVVRSRVASDATGTVQLVAYVVAPGGPEEPEIRAQLKKRLPDYMVPRYIMLVPSLPLKPNGKVDAEALPQPSLTRDRLGTPYVAPRSSLETMLADLWRDLLDLDAVGIDDDFFDLGGNSLTAARMVTRLQSELSAQVYMVAIFEAPTVATFAAYLHRHYRPEVRLRFGTREVGGEDMEATVDEAAVERFRSVVTPFRRGTDASARRRVSKAVFVLSPPRCGSTLTRVLLGGHPSLFAPPELQLLLFDTLADRSSFFEGGRLAFYLEGAVRAVMEAEALDFNDASIALGDMARSGASTLDLYHRLQDAVAPALLVDKTASYVLDEAALRGAERDFEEPFYIHLVRDPVAMIASFIETRQDQVFFLYEHDFTVRQLAELVWLVGNRNVLNFLNGIPDRRHARLHYEDLITRPAEELERLCGAMGLPFVPAMAQAYDQRSRRMTDPARPGSLMVGDLKFHQRAQIDQRSAVNPAREVAVGPLSEPTRALAAELGYAFRAGEGSTSGPAIRHPALIRLRSEGGGTPFFMIHGVGGSVANYRPFANILGADRPVYALQAPALEPGGRLFPTLAAQASAYLDIIRQVQAEDRLLLGGWSFGGIVAWEMAQQVRAGGGEVDLLVLVDSYPPQNLVIAPLDMMLRFAQDFVTGVGHPGWLMPKDLLLHQSIDDWPSIVVASAVDSGVVKAGSVAPRRFAELHKLYDAHVRAAQAYYPRPYAGSVVSFLIDGASPDATSADWAFFTRGPLAVFGLPGDHHACLKAPLVLGWTEKLRGLLSEAVLT